MADKTKGQKKANEAAGLFGGLINKARLSIYNREDDIDARVEAMDGSSGSLAIKKKPAPKK